MLKGQLAKWSVGKDAISVTLLVPNNLENRVALASIPLEEQIDFETAQGMLDLEGGSDAD